MSWLTMLLPALVPALGDGLRGLFAKWTGSAGAQPQNVAEAIQMMQAHTERLRALAELDRPEGNISRWVSDLRASFRYFAIIILWAVAGMAFAADAPMPVMLVLLDMCGASLSFIIGERMYLRLKG